MKRCIRAGKITKGENMKWCKSCNRQIMSMADYDNALEQIENPIFCICKEPKGEE